MEHGKTVGGEEALRRAIEDLLTGDAEGIKRARKELDRLRLGVNGKRRRIRLINDAFARLPRAAPRNQAAFLSAIGWSALDAIQERREAFFEEVMQYLHSPSGAVRQGALRLASWWRMTAADSFTRLEPKKEYARMRPFLVRIKREIARERPAGAAEKHIDALPPSVYKSLLLLWEECVRNAFMQELMADDTELRDDEPVRSFQDDEWLKEHESAFAETADALWRESPPGADARKAMEELERRSVDAMGAAVAALGFAPNGITRLIHELQGCVSSPEESGKLFEDFVWTCLHNGLEPEDLNGVVRAFQGAANHIVWKNRRGEPVSCLLTSCALMREQELRKEPRDMRNVALLLYGAHRELDHFAEAEQSAPSPFEGWPEELRAGENEWLRKRASLAREIRSIAGHALDWYFQLVPWGVLRHSASKHAATALFIVKRFNEEHGNWIAFPFSEKRLAALAGMKTMNRYSSFYYALKHGVRDPDLLMIRGENEADECEEVKDAVS